MNSGHIFLSCSTTDRPLADDLRARLEAGGLRVRMAPRDGQAGPDAIETSAAVLALVSDAANRSGDFRTEIEIAFNAGRPLFPVRFHDIAPARELALFLGLGLSADLFGPDEAGNFDRLVAELRRLPGVIAPAPVPPPAPAPPPPELMAAAPPPAASGKGWVVAAIAIGIAVILGVVLLATMRDGRRGGSASNNIVAESPSYDDAMNGPASMPALEAPRNEAAAAAVPPADAPPPADSGDDWIAGSWILAGETCGGRQGATYGTDRNWATAGGGGTWSISGTTLTNITYYRIREGVRVPRTPPLTARYEALSITPQQILLRFPDGREQSLYRCP